MKKLMMLCALMALCLSAFASNSTVTATVSDTDAVVWINGAWSAKLVLPGGTFGQKTPTVNGVAVPATAKGFLSASGVLTATLTDTSSLDQTGGKWAITVCPNASYSPNSGTGCFTLTTPVVGTTVDLTARLTGIVAPRFPAGPGAFGYADVEVNLPTDAGAQYYNVGSDTTKNGVRIWNGQAWKGGGGGGGGTSPTGTGFAHVSNGSTDSAARPVNVASSGTGGDVSGVLSPVNGGTGAAGTFTGLRKANGAGADTMAIADTDFASVSSVTAVATTANNASTTASSASTSANAALAAAAAVKAGGFSLTDTAHLLALYNFNETSGTTLNDVSGHGNDGVINVAPTMSGTGYTFTASTQKVTLPTGINSANTYYFSVYFLPIAPGGNPNFPDNNNNTYLLSNTLNTSNALVIATGNPTVGPYAMPGITTNQGLYSLQLYSVSGPTLKVGDIYAGLHLIALSCPSGSDGQFYLDGVPLKNVSGTGSCYNLQNGSTDNFVIGVDRYGFWPIGFTYYEVAFFSAAHTQAQVVQNSAALRQATINKGGLPLNQDFYYPTSNNVFMGDSILCGYGISGSSVSCAKGTTDSRAMPGVIGAYLNNTYTSYNYSQPGSLVETSLVGAPQVTAPFCKTNYGTSNFIWEGGTNEFQTALAGVTTNAGAFAKAQALGGIMSAAKCRPIMMTLTSHGGTYTGSTSYDSVLQSYAVYQRANWKNSYYVGLVDLGTDCRLGCTGSASNTTYFQSDQLHLTVAGEDVEAQAVACIINGLDGSSSTNMNPTPITTATTLGCPDGGRYVSPASNGDAAITLPSAMWQTGRRVQYCNTSSTYTGLVNAPSDFPFNNVSGATSITLSANSCVRLEARFTGNTTTGGAFWATY